MIGPEPIAAARRTGVVLRDPLRWSELLQLAAAAEDTAYEAVFVPEIDAREAFGTLAGLAARTSRVRLGTGVVTIASRSPQTTAMAAATVMDLSGGRLILGVGAGNRGRLELVRRYIGEIRGSRLGFVPEGGHPPIWLGALGDGMIALAGAIADGVILNWCTPERVSEARMLVDRSAQEAGKAPGSVTVGVYVRACLGVEESLAMAALRATAGRYAAIPQYQRQLQRMGLGKEAALAAKAHRAGRPDEVPDELVRTLTVVGGRTEALARFEAYHHAGADLVLCYPVAALEPYSSILGTMLAAAPSTAVER
jgi:alkanesulfonate monooxygenase SsuD/methylene tetrahydromethanopterin reductase-like flavin-dependent oxidoreductase (luciferase family)